MFNKSQSSNLLDTKLSNTATTALMASPMALDTRNFSGLNLQNSTSSSSDLNTSLNTTGSTQSTGSTASTVDAGGLMSTATKWAPLNSRTHYAYGESIGGSDSNDLFQFSLNNNNDFNLVMSGLSADADISLLDSYGNTIKSSRNLGTHGDAYNVGTSEAFNVALNGGTYYLKVSSYDGRATDYKMNFLATPTTSTQDWYTQNLGDSGIRNWARQFYNDGQLGRTDMMTIFRSAMDYGGIDAGELNDLRKVVNSFSMPDSVSVLSNKVVNGDPANSRSGIGNLSAVSGALQMEKLIGKWFMGTDLPTASGTYQRANGSLFQNGISYTDVDQGGVGDCYFMASLATVAQRTPNSIRNMFTDNGDGTFTVRFFTNGKADYVTVDRYLPTDNWGGFIYANNSSGLAYNDSRNELWGALAEKAYAQINESGGIGHDNTNSYNGIHGGYSNLSLNHITGRSTARRDVDHHFLFFGSDDAGMIADAASRGCIVTLNTKHDVQSGLVGNHTYALLGYNSSSQRYIIYNPWGGEGSTIEMNKAALLNNFESWDFTTN